jgi:ATP-dependent Clp protease adaptor protein ClpS
MNFRLTSSRQICYLVLWKLEPGSSNMATTFPKSRPAEESETQTRRQPPYAVILHNDDHNGADYVVNVLRKVFGYTVEKSEELMMEAHKTGRSAVWVGAMEVAELKADQIHSCGPDPRAKASGAEALHVTVEPAA